MSSLSFDEIRYAWPRGQDIAPQITVHGAISDDGGDRREFVAMRRHGLVEVQPLWGPLPDTARVEVAAFVGPRFERLAADINEFCSRYAPGRVLPGTGLHITGIGIGAATAAELSGRGGIPFAGVMLAGRTSPRMEAYWLLDARGGWSFGYVSDAGDGADPRVEHPGDRRAAAAELAFRLGAAAARSALVALDNTARALVPCLRGAKGMLPGME